MTLCSGEYNSGQSDAKAYQDAFGYDDLSRCAGGINTDDAAVGKLDDKGFIIVP